MSSVVFVSSLHKLYLVFTLPMLCYFWYFDKTSTSNS